MAKVEQRHTEAADAALGNPEVLFQGEYAEALERVAQALAEAEAAGSSRAAEPPQLKNCINCTIDDCEEARIGRDGLCGYCAADLRRKSVAAEPTPAQAEAPRKAIEVKVTANGFTWEEVIMALDERVERLTRNRELGAGCYADGYGASHTADVHLREVTREQFADESIAWLERKAPK